MNPLPSIYFPYNLDKTLRCMTGGPLGHSCKVIDNYGHERNCELQVHVGTLLSLQSG
ncbi:hypothetical protein HanRHA438_Chr13g0620841 [Helianthus annuus]|nr:hypothetical protein HanRHA438_Chr13g0620841 [Helianthus annuus]